MRIGRIHFLIIASLLILLSVGIFFYIENDRSMEAKNGHSGQWYYSLEFDAERCLIYNSNHELVRFFRGDDCLFSNGTLLTFESYGISAYADGGREIIWRILEPGFSPLAQDLEQGLIYIQQKMQDSYRLVALSVDGERRFTIDNWLAQKSDDQEDFKLSPSQIFVCKTKAGCSFADGQLVILDKKDRKILIFSPEEKEIVHTLNLDVKGIPFAVTAGIDGEILVLAQLSSEASNSSIGVLTIRPDGTVKQVFSYITNLKKRLERGSIDRLPSGNLLVSLAAEHAQVLEFNPQGELKRLTAPPVDYYVKRDDKLRHVYLKRLRVLESASVEEFLRDSAAKTF